MVKELFKTAAFLLFPAPPNGERNLNNIVKIIKNMELFNSFSSATGGGKDRIGTVFKSFYYIIV
jgi:hypothetical protein